jgi:MFS transporter, DHA1 family, 2-module integral membrane pump EmrD
MHRMFRLTRKNLLKKSPTLFSHITFIYSFFLLLSSMMLLALYTPSLPKLMHDLQVSSATIKSTITMYFLGFFLAQFFYSDVSVYYGKRLIILANLALCIISSTIIAGAFDIELILIGRLLQGLGAGALYNTARDLLSHLPPTQKSISYKNFLSMSILYVPLICPYLGGHLEHALGWRITFLSLCAWFTMLFVFYYRYFPSPPKNKHRTQLHLFHFMRNNLRTALTQTQHIKYSLFAAIPICTVMTYLVIMPFILQGQLHANAFEYGLFGLILALSLLMAKYIKKTLKKHNWPLRHLLIMGLIFFCAGAIWLCCTHFLQQESVMNLFVGMTFIFIGCFFININDTIFLNTLVQGGVSMSSGAFSFVQSFIMFIMSLLLSHFVQESTFVLALIYLTLGILGLFLVPRLSLRTVYTNSKLQ